MGVGAVADARPSAPSGSVDIAKRSQIPVALLRLLLAESSNEERRSLYWLDKHSLRPKQVFGTDRCIGNGVRLLPTTVRFSSPARCKRPLVADSGDKQTRYGGEE